ncbi:peptidase associated/transthyretin-like domain-containing protein [Draconibacterium mangrovi]|uniref:hypothetical protein n=1 Tax=Draconibacterium mangrovi TaxID=2697469 RepID=UPI0013D63E30|nr:hypothetical protein [Draconibacterium mangrovi]
MKNNRIRNVLKGLSFTSAMFIFQACYGTPQDFGYDRLVEGQVTSETTGLPIKGIKVSVAGDNSYYVTTDDEGKFSFYSEKEENVLIGFEDIDGDENGAFRDLFKTVEDISESVYLEIALKDKL